MRYKWVQKVGVNVVQVGTKYECDTREYGEIQGNTSGQKRDKREQKGYTYRGRIVKESSFGFKVPLFMR